MTRAPTTLVSALEAFQWQRQPNKIITNCWESRARRAQKDIRTRFRKARAQISSRPESRRQILGRKIQAVAGSLRRSLRCEKTPDVRPVRLLQRNAPPGGCRAPGGQQDGECAISILAASISAAGQARRAAAAAFRDLFSQFFRGGRGGKRAAGRAEPGADLEYQIEIDFWEAVRGTVKKIHDHAARCLRQLPRHGRRRLRADLPDLRRHRERFSKPRARCASMCPARAAAARASSRNSLPDLRRRRPRAPHRNHRRSHSRGRANGSRVRVPGKAMRERWARRRAISTSSPT